MHIRFYYCNKKHLLTHEISSQFSMGYTFSKTIQQHLSYLGIFISQVFVFKTGCHYKYPGGFFCWFFVLLLFCVGVLSFSLYLTLSLSLYLYLYLYLSISHSLTLSHTLSLCLSLFKPVVHNLYNTDRGLCHPMSE